MADDTTSAAAATGTSDDALVSQFMAFTGSADPTRAASYLEMSSGNLETAVGLYMEHEQSVSSMGGAGSGGGMGGGDAAGMGAGAEIRAPDATQTMRLMDDHMGGGGMGGGMGSGGGGMMAMNPDYQLMREMMEEQLESAFAAPPAQDVRAVINAAAAAAAGNGADEDDDAEYNYEEKEDMDEDEDDDEVQVLPVQPRLSDMFAPPADLMHRAGGFQGARTVAKDSRRWLLVNIQKDSEFASHALNRDVWRDELVENLIREGFIFWQQPDVTAEARTYITRYQVQDYPHIAFIDPRTGRLMWRKEGWTQENPMTSELFAEVAMDFCSRNSFDRPPQAPRPGSNAAGTKRPTKRPMHEMSEDEQLQAAMRASMGELPLEDDSNGAGGDNDDVEFLGTGDDESKPQAKVVAAAPPKEPSWNDELVGMTVGEEPAKGARLQFRMPDGKRVVRKFDPADNVKVIYAFVAQANEEASGGREFVLMAGFPPKDLIDSIDSTIDACSLSGQAITVRWKE